MSITIQSGIEGINGSTVIGGTRLPWHDRLGAFVATVGGGFTVNASPPYPVVPASSITVKINGKVANVTQLSPANTGSWEYRNHDDQIAVGLRSGTFTTTAFT